MKTKIISTRVAKSVALDTTQYGRVLTVAASGQVAPSAAGADGIAGRAMVHNDRVTNAGSVLGGPGASTPFARNGGAGGGGINLAGGGRTANHGVIAGGQGGAGYSVGGTGGDGVALGGTGTAENTGTITGGAGGASTGFFGTGGAGGAGIALNGGGDVTNRGIITGGAAGTGAYPTAGGAGITLAGAGTVTNWGTIAGGANFRAVFDGGVGVNLAGGTLLNHGLITGGMAADGVQFQQDGTLRNTGTIMGGTGPDGAGGGIGVVFNAAGSATNAGLIAGAAGSYAMLFRGTATLANAGTLAGGTGGIALSLQTAGTVLNTGMIDGGGGAIGVQLQSGATLTNTGTIAGGGAVGGGGPGGEGVYVFGGSAVVNQGAITGGAGAYGGYGVRLSGAGATLLDTGTIEGGYGGTAGGIGVAIDGTTLTNSGTIAGGLDGGGTRADAVQFGFYGGTLVISPTAVFEGAIQAGNYGSSTIVLAGHQAGTLSGLGTSITGITNIVEDASAHWTLSGSLSGTGALDIGADARLTLDGACSIATIAFGATGHGTLALDQPALVTSVVAGFGGGDTIELSGIAAASFTFHHDTLTLFDANHVVVDTMQFSGHLTAADIDIVADGKNTDIVYAGPGNAIIRGLGHAAIPDMWQHFGPQGSK
jgi:hypothetical protein